MPGEDTSSRYAPETGSATSSTGEICFEITSQSSIVIDAVGPLRHQLHDLVGRGAAALNFYTHQSETEIFEHRFDHRRDFGRNARLAQKTARIGSAFLKRRVAGDRLLQWHS